jgi:hypothetical protein
MRLVSGPSRWSDPATRLDGFQPFRNDVRPAGGRLEHRPDFRPGPAAGLLALLFLFADQLHQDFIQFLKPFIGIDLVETGAVMNYVAVGTDHDP